MGGRLSFLHERERSSQNIYDVAEYVAASLINIVAIEHLGNNVQLESWTKRYKSHFCRDDSLFWCLDDALNTLRDLIEESRK
jgi:hypothetical protein